MGEARGQAAAETVLYIVAGRARLAPQGPQRPRSGVRVGVGIGGRYCSPPYLHPHPGTSQGRAGKLVRFIASSRSWGGAVLTNPSAPGYSGRPEDEAYDEDGNPLPDFYDSDPPDVGSPASAQRDAYALYFPPEKRYPTPRASYTTVPGSRVARGAGRRLIGTFFPQEPTSPSFSLGGFPRK